MTAAVDCQVLDWDSEFFGRRIARVESREIDPAAMVEIRKFAEKEGVECLYLLLDASDHDSIRAAEGGGFQCVDVRVTLERALEGEARSMPERISSFRDEDLPRLCAIARVSHEASRFYHDPHFDRRRCAALYETWISKDCTETPENVLVARLAGEAVGYLSCELDARETGSIGLVAVAEGARGLGFGADLVEASLAWFAARERSRVRVVTQGRNRGAKRLYHRFGFEVSASENWYHFWPAPEDAT